jgi:putative ABC transport system permease protein
VKAYDLVELAARNLRESLLRSSLTTLGIGVGVASLVAMLSLGVGLQALAGERLSRSGLFDTIVVYSRRDVRGFGAEQRRAGPPAAESPELDDAARQRMAALPGVAEVYPEIRFTTEIRYGGRTHFTNVAGLPLSARENEAFDSLKGNYFSGEEAEEAIVLEEFARELAPDPASLVGQELVLRYLEQQALNSGDSGSSGENWGFSMVRQQKRLRIVGVVETEPFGGWRSFARGRVFLPIGLAEELNAMQFASMRTAIRSSSDQPPYISLLVRLSSPSQVQAAQKAINQMGFTTWSILDATQSLRRFFVIVDLFLGIFGSLALAVASLGIVNTLVMAILERRREIGILKALGASDRDVRRLFFAEAGAMGLVGGMLGVGMGWLIGRAINAGTNVYLARQELPPETIVAVPWWLATVAIGFAILVSLAAGIYPAARAAKLDPVQALRYE